MSTPTVRHQTDITERLSKTAGLVKRHRMVVAVLLGAIVFQLAFIASFTGADARPVLNQVTIGLVGSSPTTAGRAGPGPGSNVTYQRYPDAAAARQAVSDGSLPAALVVRGSNHTLVVAEAAGLTLAAAIEQVATVLPPPGWIIGGYLGMTLLSRVLGARSRGLRGTATLTAWTAAYALASAGLGVVLLDPLMGALTGHPWALLAAGTLIVFAAAMSTAALMSLFGVAGVVVAIVAFVVLGNPTSGGSVPVQMLSGGFGFLADILPNYAGLALVSGFQYFGGNVISHALIVLALYAAIATAVCFVRALRHPRPARAEAPAGPELQPVAQ